MFPFSVFYFVDLWLLGLQIFLFYWFSKQFVLLLCMTMPPGENAMMDEDNAILRYGHQFADYLGRGLADNWSQVSINIKIIAVHV